MEGVAARAVEQDKADEVGRACLRNNGPWIDPTMHLRMRRLRRIRLAWGVGAMPYYFLGSSAGLT